MNLKIPRLTVPKYIEFLERSQMVGWAQKEPNVGGWENEMEKGGGERPQNINIKVLGPELTSCRHMRAAEGNMP